jgi:hypothetical protein
MNKESFHLAGIIEFIKKSVAKRARQMDEWMNIPTNYVQNVIFKLKIKNILIA